MKHRCPWWLGYLLINPFRKLRQDPGKILSPYVLEGMTVLEPGPGMGFFTLEMARLVGPTGRVVVVDVQQKMLDGLKKRAGKAGVLDRIDARLITPKGLGVEDLAGKVDFVLAFAMVHEVDDAAEFFAGVCRALKTGGKLLFAEPPGHVTKAGFEQTLALAQAAGFAVESRPRIPSSHAALLAKSGQ